MYKYPSPTHIHILDTHFFPNYFEVFLNYLDLQFSNHLEHISNMALVFNFFFLSNMGYSLSSLYV